jgi:ribosomal protein L22
MTQENEKPKTEDLNSPQRESPQRSEELRSKSESETKKETKVSEEKSQTPKAEVTKAEDKSEPKKEESKEKPKDEKKTKKKDERPIIKKEEAIANGSSVPISKKQGMYICTFIKNKPIDKAIQDLNSVILYKKAVPFKGEIPHRKGGQPGRYPIKAAGYFINLLKGLKGNVIVNGMDLDKTKIYIASASWASRPGRSGNRSAKRTNVILKAKEFVGGKK